MKNKNLKIFTVLPSSNMNPNLIGRQKTMKEELLQCLDRFGTHIMSIVRRKPEHQNQEELEEGTDSKCINGFLGPFAIIICISSTFGVMLLPTHNIFISPECWYELTFSTSLYYLFTSTVILFFCSKSAKLAEFYTMKMFTLISRKILSSFPINLK